jgi:hypothetical protein
MWCAVVSGSRRRELPFGDGGSDSEPGVIPTMEGIGRQWISTFLSQFRFDSSSCFVILFGLCLVVVIVNGDVDG